MFTSCWGRNIWRPCAACVTCGFRPRKKRPELVITSTTLYYNASFYSNPVCDCGHGSLLTSVPRGYFISWIPLRSLNDQEVDIDMHGSFNVSKCTCCGIYGCIAPQTPTADQVNKGENTASYCNLPLPHCPVYSSAQLKLGTLEGFSYRFHSITRDHNWLKDFKLMKMQALLGVIQVFAWLAILLLCFYHFIVHRVQSWMNMNINNIISIQIISINRFLFCNIQNCQLFFYP